MGTRAMETRGTVRMAGAGNPPGVGSTGSVAAEMPPSMPARQPVVADPIAFPDRPAATPDGDDVGDAAAPVAAPTPAPSVAIPPVGRCLGCPIRRR